MNKIEAHVQQWKKDEVKDIIRLFNEYPLTGVVNLQNLPALQCMKIRKGLKDIMYVKMTKRRLILKAIEQMKDKPNIEKLIPHLNGMPSLVFSKENPFSLYKQISRNKSKAAAKAGQVAPNDLSVDAGPTPFAPGPVIGELGKLGLKTEVKEGKIHLKEGKVLVNMGEVIKPQVADLLVKLGIEPMEIGLNLVATYEKGEILTRQVFGVDEKEYIANIKLAANEARSLAVFIEYPDPEILKLVVKKAEVQAKALAQKANFETDVNTDFKGEATVEQIETPKSVETSKEEKKEEPKPMPEVKPETTQARVQPQPTPDKPSPEPEPRPEPEPKKPEPKPTPEPPQQDTMERDIKTAQDVLKKMQDEAMKGKIPTPSDLVKNKTKFENQNKDVSDIINQLKDKKSKGEI